MVTVVDHQNNACATTIELVEMYKWTIVLSH